MLASNSDRICIRLRKRVHLLSPDIRRPGRVGDLIIPVLDPEGDDREAFIRWVVKDVYEGELSPEVIQELTAATMGLFAASFAFGYTSLLEIFPYSFNRL